MAETAYELEIVTPESVIYQGRVLGMILPAADGLMGVLPNHAPIVAALDIGPVSLREESGEKRQLLVTDGFFEMADNKARLLTDAGERAEDIDVERARRAEARARERLAVRGTHGTAELVDYERAERALQRALQRILVALHLAQKDQK